MTGRRNFNRRDCGPVVLIADRLMNTRGQPVWQWKVTVGGREVGAAYNRHWASEIPPAKGQEWRALLGPGDDSGRGLGGVAEGRGTRENVGHYPSPEVAALAVLGTMHERARELFIKAGGAGGDDHT